MTKENRGEERGRIEKMVVKIFLQLKAEIVP